MEDISHPRRTRINSEPGSTMNTWFASQTLIFKTPEPTEQSELEPFLGHFSGVTDAISTYFFCLFWQVGIEVNMIVDNLPVAFSVGSWLRSGAWPSTFN